MYKLEAAIVDYYVYVVAAAAGLTPSDLKGRCRSYPIVKARDMAMDRIWRNTEMTLSEIGEHFDNRSPGTVSHGIQKVGNGQ